MAIDVKRERIIGRLNRDFASLKRDLITYSKAYATGSFTDFNETSPGMTLLELAAYVGDGLHYSIDFAFNEGGDSATQLKNVQANAKMRGYRPQGKRPAIGELDWAIVVPAVADSNGVVVPDERYTPTLLKGSQAVSTNGTIFETLDDVPFTASMGRQVTGSQFDPTSGVPTQFALRRKVDVVAGRTVTEQVSITEFRQFRRLELGQADVIEVIDVFDSQGNEWFEVDYHAQDWVFIPETNENSDSDDVPYVLRLRTVPRRFVVDRDVVSGISALVFGSGDGLSYDDELVPNVADYSLPLAGRRTISSFAIDPQNFLRTRSLGLSPHNTTLTIRYRVGGGSETNVAARSVRQVAAANLSFASTDLDPVTKGIVEGSIGCLNIRSMANGGPAETAQEIKANAAAFFSAQNRVVTKEDVVARTMALPARFGRIERASVTPSAGAYSYDVHIISKNSAGHLVPATPTLKSNLATFLQKFRMLTDGINILDSDVFDLRVYFGVVVAPNKNKSEVLLNCTGRLTRYFSQDNFPQPIVLSDVVAELNATSGVVSVYELRIVNVSGVVDGLAYSDGTFNVANHTQNGMLSCPPGASMQIKYPSRDIIGSAR